jgi:hypothetical protein
MASEDSIMTSEIDLFPVLTSFYQMSMPTMHLPMLSMSQVYNSGSVLFFWMMSLMSVSQLMGHSSGPRSISLRGQEVNGGISLSHWVMQ